MSGAGATAHEAGPQLSLQQVSAEWNEAAQRWNIRWRITNRGLSPLTVIAARLPHGQFKSDEIRFAPPLDLPADASEQFETSVRCQEPSGLVTENAFIIFDVVWLREPWRIFARISVFVDGGGRAADAAETVTTQKVGFSRPDA